MEAEEVGGGGLAMVVGWMVALQGWICGGGGGGHGSLLGRVRLRGRVARQLLTRVDKKRKNGGQRAVCPVA